MSSRIIPVFVLFLLILLPRTLEAQIPKVIAYQGVLSDTTGNPKPDGTYTLTFTLYDTNTGGQALWNETKTLSTKRGLFFTALGDQTPFSASVKFEKPYWLGIKVGNNPELSPRIPLTSVGYSLNSLRADTAKVALSAPTGSGGWKNGGTVVTLQTNSDSVGIGTSSPKEKLHVEGNLYVSGKASIGPNNVNTGLNANAIGEKNEATGSRAIVSGGLENKATNDGTVVGGGAQNMASGKWATAGGGEFNKATGQQATISGGWDNKASGHGATISGGGANIASGWQSAVGGGWDNDATDSSATVSGGWENAAQGVRSTVPGGYRNSAQGAHSFAAGYRAKANHNGTFVWADQTLADFTSTAANQYLIRASSGVGINTNNPSAALHIGGTPGVDGIKFPDGTLQTTAATGGGSSGWVDDGTVVRLSTQTDLVGIGTASPQAPLHVNPSVATGSANVSAAMAHQKHGSGAGTSHLKGFYGKAETNSWTGTNNLYGLYGESLANNTSGSAVQNMYGVYGKASGNGVGTQTAIGGYFSASGADNNYAAVFDSGNVGIGTTQPTAKLHIDGTPGTDGIKFPDGTLQTTGALPGGTQNIQGAQFVVLASGLQNLLTQTIDCPAAGYVMVMASCEVTANHAQGVLTSGDFGVSDVSATLDPDQRKAWYLTPQLPTGTYRNVLPAQKMFAVNTGTNTFYLVTDKISGNMGVENMTLSLMFLPAAYGTVVE